MPEFFKIKKNIVILLLFAFFVLILVFFFCFNRNSGIEQTQSLIPSAPKIPRHDCALEQFSQTVKPEDKASFEILLKPSAPGRNYRLSPSGFPKGVNGVLTEDFQGETPSVRVDLDISPDAPAGSYTLALRYEEEDDEGEYLLNMCKYNLIIE